MLKQYKLEIDTPGRGISLLTDKVAACVQQTKIKAGLCHLFIQHTSASLLINENTDTVVQHDLERFMQHMVPDGWELFKHVDEGKDDMPAHVRTILTETSLTIPIINNALGLGRWQGIYLFEHRLSAHKRHVIVTLQGEI